MQYFLFVFAAFVTLHSIFMNADALIEPIAIPTTLLDCFGYKTEVLNITEIPAQSINSYCIDYFLRTTFQNRFYYNITEDAMKWVHSLLRGIASKHERHKRQAISRARRNRVEIRLMTPRQWNRFTYNVNRLKNDRSIFPNRYDALALLHQGIAEASAHGGSNFLGWHCIYLLVLEEALGTSVPYWDSRKDYNMDRPVESIVWSRFFFGNGDGEVITGPFANWQTPAGPLRRNINSGNSLMTPLGVRYVLSRSRHSQIVEPQQDLRFSLEAHHNGPHNWVDGLLAGLSTSAFDPIFFMHHSFIEYVWHIFKDRQDRRGIPRRYFPSGSQLHHPFRRMDGFPWYRNIDGYDDYFRFLVAYSPAPSCPGRCQNPTWGFPVLQCNQQGLCESGSALNIASERERIMQSTRTRGGPSADIARFGAPSMSADGARFGTTSGGGRFRDSPFVDPRTRGKRSVPNLTPAIHELFTPYKNTFYLDGVTSINEWVFMLVKVSSESTEGNKTDELTLDVSNVTINEPIPENSATYSKCLSSGTGLKKVFVQSHGINYEGKFKNFVVIDNLHTESEDVTFIGFKKPSDIIVEAYVSAYDLCGRVCQPKCLVIGSNPPEYRLCSGTLSLSRKQPLMFYSSYDEAEIAAANMRELISNKRNHQNPIFMEFLCTDQHKWPWNYLLNRK